MAFLGQDVVDLGSCCALLVGVCLSTLPRVEGHQPQFGQELGQVVFIWSDLSRCEGTLSYQSRVRPERCVEVSSNNEGVPLGHLPDHLRKSRKHLGSVVLVGL